MEYHTPTQLGRTQSLTKEGFLLVRDVRIGRVGEQVYLPTELINQATGKPLVQPGPDGLVRVQRTADEVFAPQSINSLNTSTFTLSHPTEWVGPTNRNEHDRGQVMNARKGTGADDGFLVADLLVKDADMIGKIRRKEIRDVSAGYGAEYRDLGGGRALQYNICHNHVAGLPITAQGRCGSECSIGDESTVTTEADKPSISDQVLSWIMGGGKPPAPAATVTVDSSPAIAALTAQVTTLTGIVETLAKSVKTSDEAKKDEWGEDADDKSDEAMARRKKAKDAKEAKTGDAMALGVKFATVKGGAEILSPGIKLPTSDVMTVDHICTCQKLALKAAKTNAKTADAVKAFGDRDIDTLDQAALDVMFAGAAELVRQANNRMFSVGATGAKTGDDTPMFQRKVTDQIEAINEANRKAWAERTAGQ